MPTKRVIMSETITLPEAKEKVDQRTKKQPPYNVILMNDDFHTVEYVVNLCQKIFGFPKEKGILKAKEVHEEGRSILWTGTLEGAELKQELIHSMGKDPAIKNCKGSMTCVLEPAA
jgi:ATP-dependent Clp protease adaptor protein ClpS